MTWKPHATVAAIIERDNKFLLVEEIVQNKRVFNQPAGHLEPNESLIEAVIRETREETAWRFEPQSLIGIYLWRNKDKPADNDASYLRFAYHGSCDDYKPEQSLDDGIVATHWFSKEEIEQHEAQLRSPLVLSCINDYLAGNRYPLEITKQVI